MVTEIGITKFNLRTQEEWIEYWSTEEGARYLEGMRGLVSTLFQWGFPVEEYEICLRKRDRLRSEALKELVRLGEIEVIAERWFGRDFRFSCLFSRRKLS